MPVGKGVNMRKLKTFEGLCLEFAWMSLKTIPYIIAVIAVSLWCMLRAERDPGWK